jgi:peptidoglycan/xylan/chitin deacetylase (PgdA/CDA1 family)
VALAPRRWPLVALALFANHVVLAAAGLWPRSRLLGPNIRSLADLPERQHEGGARELALTFDDGPDPRLTPRVLDLLDTVEAKATFFVIGSNASRHPDLVTEIAARGHSLANHTWSHRASFCMRGPVAIASELSRTQNLLRELLGLEPRYFRAPAGFRNPWLEPLLAREGLKLVSWSRRGYDARERDPSVILTRLEPGITADGVLVLHDGRPPGDAGRQPELPILDVLPKLLQTCVERDFALIALPNPYKTTKSLTPVG